VSFALAILIATTFWSAQDSTKSGPRRANVRPHGIRN
jgi:hypothetical protein